MLPELALSLRHSAARSAGASTLYAVSLGRIRKGGIVLAKREDILHLSGLRMPTHMEINGNTEAVVDGCSGILEYDTDVVRIRTGKLIVRFEGRGLTIKCLTTDSLVVTGFITGIEFKI
jgi:sporulation protein YqfC